MKVATIKDYVLQLNWLLVLFTLLVFVGLIKLGLWQSARATEKYERLIRITELSALSAFSINQVMHLKMQDENINDLPIEITGYLNPDKVFLLDNQTHQGKIGYRVLQVMELGASSVLINLGWVAGSKIRTELPTFKQFSGNLTILGHVRVPESGIQLAEDVYQQNEWPKRVQQIELAKISQVIGQKMLPFVIYLDKKESIGYIKNWQPIVMPPEKHQAYAFQWFSLAAAWLVLMCSASIWHFRQGSNNNKRESYGHNEER